MNQKEQEDPKTKAPEKPHTNRTKFLESLEKLRRMGLVVHDGTKRGRMEIFIGGVRPPKREM
jgi:hypothetical protein